MQLSFHTDPLDISTICAELDEYGAVLLETTRPNFKKISRSVEDSGSKVLSLTVQSQDGDFHHYLLRYGDEDGYDLQATNARVLKAIQAWQSRGCPLPYVEAV